MTLMIFQERVIFIISWPSALLERHLAGIALIFDRDSSGSGDAADSQKTYIRFPDSYGRISWGLLAHFFRCCLDTASSDSKWLHASVEKRQRLLSDASSLRYADIKWLTNLFLRTN
jgi:hypothetical protein